ncbi:MAG: flagellar hook-basal body complex protein [Muribaculaceae bacterium]|nr:flagellar hook-basal body complex protein [Roseburia sp.]MCM1431070.1 flagellar hook-basal body complex protein [Muribaculaceae bacterium]MCM1493330.1 flagellar hook-basal body complex protein [Muribaculaceae bacterium]
MMRSLFSAVSGLKTHQTRMDVIGNNISNVNTEAFKASNVRFSEIMYQTNSSASAGDGATGIGGVNAKQIGLGVATASTMCNITGAGAAETTGYPFDLRLSDSQTTNFFIVSDGSNTLFTRAGSFYVDGNGYLCMSSTGYTLQGWQVDQATGEIRKDTVSPLQVMSAQNQTASPEATEKAYISGILDKLDPNIEAEGGYVMTLGFYDDLGYTYTAKFSVTQKKNDDGTDIAGYYHIDLVDIVDANSERISQLSAAVTSQDANNDGIDDGLQAALTEIWGSNNKSGYDLVYDSNKGTFVAITETDTTKPSDTNGTTGGVTITKRQSLNLSSLNTGFTTDLGADNVPPTQASNFKNIEIDFANSLNQNNSKVSTMKALRGTNSKEDGGDGAGKKVGRLTGLQVDQQGCVYGSYDNGNTVLLCQIAVAQFANASGLEKVGDNCYQTTLNSGEFDGIGVEVSSDGSKINSGELEMSNVDLSGQFTDMIITQRGFQANSRVITVSDTLLEELINLKR